MGAGVEGDAEVGAAHGGDDVVGEEFLVEGGGIGICDDASVGVGGEVGDLAGEGGKVSYVGVDVGPANLFEEGE